MACFAIRGKETLEIKGVIVVSSLAVGIMNCRPSTVDTSLNFKGSASKRPTKRGCHQKRFFVFECPFLVVA